MEIHEGGVIRNCVIKLREGYKKRRDKVYVGCGAGFGGYRPLAALKLLQRVKELNYIMLKCLTEHTLAERYQVMVSGGDGNDSRISDWMRLLLPLAVERGTCIITNMGASSASHEKSFLMEGGISTYLGAAPIVECLIYELGWNWNNLEQLAQGSLAGHLLECGCQLMGGILHAPRGQVSRHYQQLLYEIGNPGAYVTPDVIIDIRDVSFYPLSSCKVLCAGAKPSAVSVPDKLLLLDIGWKGWGEISYGGFECVKRAKIAEFLVRSWMEEVIPDVSSHVVSYIVGLDSLKASGLSDTASCQMVSDIRLRMYGLFKLKEHAVQFYYRFYCFIYKWTSWWWWYQNSY
ncbi:putative acyclic terpene utilization [Rosa chinensis]|uniref:Putative acyclic terpene utilization n=1 Tax=Rosa chinensis TaxID=74649 RepID=A0A2P6SH14_ROSCH|nr:putative acyclic terpene utilization [Rosa chinensis]